MRTGITANLRVGAFGVCFCLFVFGFTPGASALAGDDELALTLGLGVETVGVNRGRRSDNMNPSTYGFIEIERGRFYGGAFATPTKIAGEVRPLLVGYGGMTHYALGVDFNMAARYFSFPSSSDFEFDLDGDNIIDHVGQKGFFEGFVGAKKSFDVVELSAKAFYSPDVFGETGAAYYLHTAAKARLPHGFDVRADIGVSKFERDLFNDDYVDYGIGVYKSLGGFDMFLRYSDTAGRAGADDRSLVFGIERSWNFAKTESVRTRLRNKVRNNWAIDKSLFGVTYSGN